MNEKTERISELCQILSNEESTSRRLEAYDEIQAIIEEEEENSQFIEFKWVKPFWLDSNYSFYKINGFSFVLISDEDGEKTGYVNPDDDSSELFETFRKAVEKDINFPIGNHFNNLIGEYLFTETNGTIGQISVQYGYLLQRLSNEIRNWDKNEFYEFIKNGIETDLEIEIPEFKGEFNQFWYYKELIDIEDFALGYQTFKQFHLDLACYEVKSNIMTYITDVFGCICLDNPKYGENSIEIKIPKSLKAYQVWDLIDNINCRFNLDCDWRQYATGLTIWLELKAII